MKNLRAAFNLAHRSGEASAPPPIPGYMKDVYTWAYLNPVNVRLFDRDPVVSLILWGNRKRLQQALFTEIPTGGKVLQSSHVYGSMLKNLAQKIGPEGRLDVIDIVPVQLAQARKKLTSCPWAHACLADARNPGNDFYDVVSSHFLLHEVPDGCKGAIVDALLERIKPGGKVVFVDYHKPRWWHPLKGVMSVVFDLLEPFAKTLWRHEISEFSSSPDDFDWVKETYFGGLYQKVVVRRL
ncbi:MAG: rhodoquinone biosynthesis methyltransferase RquA [Proteobacteria bacterium]|nr:rhodoquinone biosynthesis methyltransferase RquA [Pseudomonadota bacterium]MDA1023320.1 rhodoquinone biosynthesis methyltransferase RquA [Pseudomonadota bacterium]